MFRKIIHLDLDAFFCAVEEQKSPKLSGKPFAVGGKPEERGVISSCSYAARQFGVRSAMPTRRALQLCPKLIVVRADHHAYSAASRNVMSRLCQWTALVEQISVDEAFLDLSDLSEPGEILAKNLQLEILEQLKLPSSLGVATNKLVAKIATDYGKSLHRGILSPCAITVVPPGGEAAFLKPLPVESLWGVGPKTASRFLALGIHTIGDLACFERTRLVEIFGKIGHDLYERAQGMDTRPVVTESNAKSISQEVTFSHDVTERKILLETLELLSEKVAQRLRQKNILGTTVKLKLRWHDFTTLTRQQTLSQPTDLGMEIFSVSRDLLEKEWKPGLFVRLIGVGVSGLVAPFHQLSLWDTTSNKNRRLQKTLDELQDRYGKDTIRRGEQRK